MNAYAQRIQSILEHMRVHQINEFSSIKEMVAYFKKSFPWGERPIQNAISFGIKKGLLKKGKRKTFGGPTGVLLGNGEPPEPEILKTKVKKESQKIIEKSNLGFTKITTLLVEKIEEILSEQNAKISEQKKEISEFKEVIEGIQLDQEKINQMEEKITRIEEEISAGTDKLLQVLNALKGK